MRPRVFPAEDSPVTRAARPRWWRFNEAAGIPRGRRPSCYCSDAAIERFNEAAGIPRGRRTFQYEPVTSGT